MTSNLVGHNDRNESSIINACGLDNQFSAICLLLLSIYILLINYLKLTLNGKCCKVSATTHEILQSALSA